MKTLTSFPRETPCSFPVKAARGTAAITIYHKSRLKGKTQYDEFLIPYTENKKRRFHHFPSYDRARSKGNEMLDLIAAGQAGAITLKEADKVVYNRALDYLRPIGVDLDIAARDYAFHWQQMGGDHFKEAVRDFLKRRAELKPTTVRELVDLFVKEKSTRTRSGQPASKVYLKDLRLRLGKFADAHLDENRKSQPLADITTDNIHKFLDSLGKKGASTRSARTRFNYGRLIGTLFHFAQARKYYPKDIDPMEGIENGFHDTSEIEIFTPGELIRALSAASGNLIPFIAIGGFAGVRHAEMLRLDWTDIHLDDAKPFIRITAAKAKTAARRDVPVSDNLKAWLAPIRRDSGRVLKPGNISWEIIHLVNKINETAIEDDKFKWKHNALRHSFISYRVADVQNVAQVALEAGNSPQMITKHYRELVRPDEAKAWFAIRPTAPANVTQMPTAAVN